MPTKSMYLLIYIYILVMMVVKSEKSDESSREISLAQMGLIFSISAAGESFDFV